MVQSWTAGDARLEANLDGLPAITLPAEMFCQEFLQQYRPQITQWLAEAKVSKQACRSSLRLLQRAIAEYRVQAENRHGISLPHGFMALYLYQGLPRASKLLAQVTEDRITTHF